MSYPTSLSSKENTELKKLLKNLDIIQKDINTTQVKYKVNLSQQRLKVKETKKKIKEIKKTEHKKAIKIKTEELNKIKQKIQEMRKQEKIKIWVKEAEIIADFNEGSLPTPFWLQCNGFNRLRVNILKKPKKFKHIKQNKRQKTIFQHVKFAEKLAKENNGILPYPLQLRQRGYICLNICMKKYPGMFAHISQEKPQRYPKDWLKIAEEISKENNGTLYNTEKMRKMGYVYLFVCMRKYPEIFSHIKKNNIRKGRTPKDWLKIAEEISKENNGNLYSQRKMKEMGYNGLYQCVQRYPKIFINIELSDPLSYNKNRTKIALNKHLKNAEKLTIENKGKLPSLKILQKHDQTLFMFIKRHPGPFEKFM